MRIISEIDEVSGAMYINADRRNVFSMATRVVVNRDRCVFLMIMFHILFLHLDFTFINTFV